MPIRGVSRRWLKRASLIEHLRAITEATQRPYSGEMQRLFSMFAGGAAGVGLLILRLSAGGSLFVYALTPAQNASPGWPLLGVGALVVLIFIGAFTPVACIMCGFVEAYYVTHNPVSLGWHAMFAIMVFLGLALLGPGAYSVDAKLFGRRLIVPDEV